MTLLGISTKGFLPAKWWFVGTVTERTHPMWVYTPEEQAERIRLLQQNQLPADNVVSGMLYTVLVALAANGAFHKSPKS